MQYIDNLGISKRDFYSQTGISRGTLESPTGITEDTMAKFIAFCPQISPEWLLSGTGEMLKGEAPRRDYSTIEGELEIVRGGGEVPRGAVPYWDLPVSAGRTVLEIVGKNTPDGYIKGLPGIEQVENILPVQGMSMEPEVSEGALIGVRKMNSYETLNTERIYLIITTEDRMIKRIEHDLNDPNILWCVSPNYPRFKIYKADIIDIQRVCFVFNPK